MGGTPPHRITRARYPRNFCITERYRRLATLSANRSKGSFKTLVWVAGRQLLLPPETPYLFFISRPRTARLRCVFDMSRTTINISMLRVSFLVPLTCFHSICVRLTQHHANMLRRQGQRPALHVCGVRLLVPLAGAPAAPREMDSLAFVYSPGIESR